MRSYDGSGPKPEQDGRILFTSISGDQKEHSGLTQESKLDSPELVEWKYERQAIHLCILNVFRPILSFLGLYRLHETLVDTRLC